MPAADASTPAPTYGNVGQLEQALDRAVFAVRAMQHRKHHVELERAEHRRLAAAESACDCHASRSRACSITSAAVNAVGG